MNYLIGIPYVNRPDLLARAFHSVRHLKRVLVIDNSEEGLGWLDGYTEIIYPQVPLSASQSLNLIRAEAIRWNSCVSPSHAFPSEEIKFVLTMHADAESVDGAVEKLIAAAEKAEGKWGVLFTHYDALAAFNIEALEDVGTWDTILPQYFTDNDYYRRMRLRGWECRDTGIEVKHEGSATINSDPKLKYLNSMTFNLYRQYYISKWGGQPGEEKWDKPFNGDMECL